MQANDFYTPLEMELKNIIDAVESNAMVLKLKGIKLQDSLQDLIKSIGVAQVSITGRVKNRMEAAMEKERKQLEPQLVFCESCSMEMMAVRTRTTINTSSGYECNVFYCEDCDYEWVDYMPVNEDDILKWHLNFITQAEILIKEKNIEIITLERLESMKVNYHKMVEAQNDALQKQAVVSQAENEAQKALLLLKVGLQDIATKMNDYVKKNLPTC